MCKKGFQDERYSVIAEGYITFLLYYITLQHCGEKLSLLIVIALGIWKSLSLLIVITRADRKLLRSKENQNFLYGLLRNSVILRFLELQGIPWNLIPMLMEVLKYRNKYATKFHNDGFSCTLYCQLCSAAAPPPHPSRGQDKSPVGPGKVLLILKRNKISTPSK
jgi:hypothetical protein